MPIFGEETAQDEILMEIAKMSGMAQDEEVQEPIEETDDSEKFATGETDDGQEEGRSEEGREEGLQVDEAGEKEDPYKNLLEAYNLQSQQLLALQAQIGLAPRGESSPPIPSGPPQQEIPLPPPPAAPLQLKIDKGTIQKALIEDDAEAMEQILLGMANQIVEHREAMREAILRDLPNVTRNVARQQLTMMKAVDEFYSKNEDLVPYQSIVGAVSNEIVAREPGLSIGEALNKTEEEVRRRLGLKRQAQAAEAARKPAFAKTKSSRKPGQPQLSGLKADIAAMQAAKW